MGEKLTHVEVYWRAKCLSICLRTAVDPDAGLGSAGFGDVKDHIRGAGVSQRRPERGQERRASQASAGASSNSARAIDR